jgi:hypothetical protein
MSAVPVPPSKVENINWLGADDCVVSSAATKAVTGTLTVKMDTLNGMPVDLFVFWHALAVVGNAPCPETPEVARPVIYTMPLCSAMSPIASPVPNKPRLSTLFPPPLK